MLPLDAVGLVDQLPWALRHDTERYLASVRENARQIFQQARVGYTSQRVEQLLLLAAIQKIWATVNTQAWIVDSALGLMGDRPRGPQPAFGAEGLRLGRSTYTHTSDVFQRLQGLRADLDQTLRQLEIRDLIRKGSLIALARSLVDRKLRGR